MDADRMSAILGSEPATVNGFHILRSNCEKADSRAKNNINNI